VVETLPGAELRRIAEAEAHQYSWDRSMEALFGQLYRQAFAASARRVVAPKVVRTPLAVPAE